MLGKKIRGKLKDAIRTAARGGELEVRPDDRWVVSYPKSGNTWLRFMVGALLQRAGDGGEVDFHNMDALVPDIYRHRERELRALPSPRFLKSHEPYDPRVARAVCMVRDPRSVATSYYFFLQRERRLPEGEPFADYLPRYLAGDLDRYGTWAEHVEGWLEAEARHPNVVVLRYEEMLADPMPGARRLAAALGLPDDDDALEAALRHSSFDRMQALDRQRTAAADPALKGKDLKILFVRKGSTDEWREHFDPQQLGMLVGAFGATMRRVGYETE